jgi:hypothetical protein
VQPSPPPGPSFLLPSPSTPTYVFFFFCACVTVKGENLTAECTFNSPPPLFTDEFVDPAPQKSYTTHSRTPTHRETHNNPSSTTSYSACFPRDPNMFNLRSTSGSPTAETSAASIQSAFRDVTNYYLNANKENIPPAGVTPGAHAGKGKGNNGCCGTPVQIELDVAAELHGEGCHNFSGATNDDSEVALGNAVPVPTAATRLSYSVSMCGAQPNTTAGAGLSIVAPNICKPRNAAPSCIGTPKVTSDSSVLSVARTPGRNVPPPSNTSSLSPTTSTTTKASKLVQQRNRSLTAAHTALLGPPFYTQGAFSTLASATAEAAATSSSTVQGSSPQPSPHCTPSGARRSAAAATAATAAARALTETPTRMDDISFYLNNSFESGSESPAHDGAVSGCGADCTPRRSFDLQQAVEEMLRGCLDSSTPAKRSEASSVSPQGSRKRQQHQLDAIATAVQNAPFNVYTALDSLFAAPAPSNTTMASSAGMPANMWVDHGMGVTNDCTPERFVAPKSVFAESDEDEGGSSQYGNNVMCGMPSAGVRRDPMAYFSTATASAATTSTIFKTTSSSPAPEQFSVRSTTGEPMPRNTDGDDIFHALPLPASVSSELPSGNIEFHNDGLTSGPDMLAMLAAAVQRQQQQSPRSAGAVSTEMDSQTFSDRDAEAAPLPPPPPSYDDGRQSSRCVRRGSAASAGAAYAPPPTRRSHHLPQVKAAAGSLIAVSGRRVPVDKLHLLSLSCGDESAAMAPPSPPASGGMGGVGGARHPSRGGAARANVQSPPSQHHHVEGPSMRRVPKANVVTVTRAPPSANSSRSRTRSGSAGVQPASACFPSPSSHTSLTDACAARTTATTTTTTRVVVAGPSARRIPPNTHSSTSLHARQGSAASNIEGGGVRQTSENDVVAVLQFSKGQTMRFLANLSASALEAAEVALSHDLESNSSSGNKPDSMTAAHAKLTRAPLSMVEVGKSYLAHVYGDQSPYENVAFEDVGVCVRLYTSTTPATPAVQACRDHVNGVLLREVDVGVYEEDRQQHERALQQQTAAYIECERQFKFSSLPFQLESIYFTFDGKVCVVFYRVVATDALTPSTAHRFSNTSRVVRELQFHLNCRVFLKQC